MSKQNTMVVTRQFQAGKDANTYDRKKFAGVVASYRNILKSSAVASLIVVVPGKGAFAEIQDADGRLPTIQTLNEEFGAEIKTNRVIPVRCDEWGPNAGSPLALNAGMKVARRHDAKFIMNWSPELDITPDLISDAHSHMSSRGLHICGFIRNRWYRNTKQFMVPQNTGAIYLAELFDIVKGFNAYTTGEHGEKITVIVDGVSVIVPIAGMEDYYFILELLKIKPDLLLGMVGQSKPLPWNVWEKLAEWKINDPAEYKRQMEKMARQPLVMDVYAKRVFPDKDPDAVTDDIISRIKLD